jgi:hypothetical protein
VRCPSCDIETRVLDTRRKSDGVYRRRVCPTCDARFSTRETIVEERPGPKPVAKRAPQKAPALTGWPPAPAAKPKQTSRKEPPSPRRREDDFWLKDTEDYGSRGLRDELKEIGFDIPDFD